MIDFNKENSFVKLKGKAWLDNQRIAGNIAADALSILEYNVCDKTTLSLVELNNMAEQFITNSGGSCTFKGYRGFPAGVCISVNNQLVHGIPTDYYLQDGDVISFDLGVTYKDAIADTAITCIYGSPKSQEHIRLIKTCNDALDAGINAISVGKRLGCIGEAISRSISKSGFSLISDYGGHGIGNADDGAPVPHAPPFVSNKSYSNEGIRIQPGLVIAIEPMAAIGSPRTVVGSDGWTVSTQGISCHVEHSIYVGEGSVEIITKRHINEYIV